MSVTFLFFVVLLSCEPYGVESTPFSVSLDGGSNRSIFQLRYTLPPYRSFPSCRCRLGSLTSWGYPSPVSEFSAFYLTLPFSDR